jgi:hypothetical protein
MGFKNMRLIQSLCIGGSVKANEDIFGHAGKTVWVMDGATGLSDTPLLPQAPSDPSWLVEAFDDFFHMNAPRYDNDLVGLVTEGIRRVRDKFDLQRARDPEHAYELPVATLVMAHASYDTLTVLTLSDSYLIARTDSGTRLLGGDPLHEALDAHSLKALTDLRAQGVTDLHTARQRLLPLIRQGRMKANQPGGYTALGIEPGIEAHLKVTTLPLPEQALLVSDGFSRLWDTFGAYTPESLLTAAELKGLEPLYAQLRRLEDADPDALRHPRLKKSDDATAVLVAF